MQWLIDIIIAAVLPPGMIMLWHGSKVTVPSGWHICDGTKGTPDLEDKFVRCASDAYPPSYTAGTTTHNHTLTGDGHSHTIVGGTDIAAGTDYAALTSLSVASGTTNTKVHVPPLHTLYYIMKL